MRVLITGVLGFTGRYVARAFRMAGWEVHGLGTASSDPGGVCDSYWQVDLCDALRMRAAVAASCPTAVVHLAGLAFVGHGDPEAFYRVNVIGTRNLLAATGRLSRCPGGVLLASSANVYGNATAGVLDESVSPNPANDYAVSKIAMEFMARLWMERLPVMIARPFNYTGVGQDDSFLLPKIVGHYRRREAAVELGNLDVVRDFSDVRVVAQKYLELVQSGASGRVFNVCSGRGRSLAEVIAVMNAMAGYEIEVRVNPAFVRANEVRKLIGSEAQLQSVIGVLPAIALEDTLAWMYGVESA